MSSHRARLLARLTSFSLVVALLVVRIDDLLQVLEHFGARIRAATFTLCPGGSTSVLVLALHLFHLALSLANRELLCKCEALLAQLLLLLLRLGFEGGLDLALLRGALLPLLLLGELGFVAQGQRVQAENLARRLLLPFGDVEWDGVFEHQGWHVLRLDRRLGAGCSRCVMEVAQSVERLEQILAQFLDLTLERSVGPVELLLEEGL